MTETSSAVTPSISVSAFSLTLLELLAAVEAGEDASALGDDSVVAAVGSSVCAITDVAHARVITTVMLNNW